jgi:hypothetical protein
MVDESVDVVTRSRPNRSARRRMRFQAPVNPIARRMAYTVSCVSFRTCVVPASINDSTNPEVA